MRSKIPANGAWTEELQKIEAYQEGYARWKKGIEEAKRTQPLPSEGGRSGPVSWLRAIVLWLRGRSKTNKIT